MSVSASQVRKIMRASAWARSIATVAMVWMAFAWGIGLLGAAGVFPKLQDTIDRHFFPITELDSWPFRIWAMLVVLGYAALWVGSTWLLRSLFSNFARGEIFCEANVRRIRGLGWLLIGGGLFIWLLPLANALIFRALGHYGTAYHPQGAASDGFTAIYYGGIVIFLSWIMAVGLGVREDAEELRRDADLVI